MFGILSVHYNMSCFVYTSNSLLIFILSTDKQHQYISQEVSDDSHTCMGKLAANMYLIAYVKYLTTTDSMTTLEKIMILCPIRD